MPEEPAVGWSELMRRCWDEVPTRRPDFAQASRPLRVGEGRGGVAGGRGSGAVI